MEGLGAVAYHEGRFPRAVHYFQLALAVATTLDNDPGILNRLQQKFSKAKQRELEGPPEDNRPPQTIRQDSFDFETLRYNLWSCMFYSLYS